MQPTTHTNPSTLRACHIQDNASFPSSVINAITADRMAKYHIYHLANVDDYAHVIHIVGPNLNTHSYTWDNAVSELTRAYAPVFSEFLLRLLPISGDIFAGNFITVVPNLSFTPSIHLLHRRLLLPIPLSILLPTLILFPILLIIILLIHPQPQLNQPMNPPPKSRRRIQ